MNIARIVVLAIALSAGGVAAYPASGSDDTKSPPAESAAKLQTVEVLVAKSDIGLGQTVRLDNLQWQTWPARSTSSNFLGKDGQNAAVGKTGTLQLALRSIADVNVAENKTEDQSPKRGESVNVVRYGVPSSTTTQK